MLKVAMTNRANSLDIRLARSVMAVIEVLSMDGMGAAGSVSQALIISGL
jgi:hypothetical protein